MAKKKSTIGDILKKDTGNKLTPEEIEKATQQIKGESKEVKESKEEKTKRLSVDTPLSLYVELKKKVAEEDTTIREFVIKQIRRGINEK